MLRRKRLVSWCRQIRQSLTLSFPTLLTANCPFIKGTAPEKKQSEASSVTIAGAIWCAPGAARTPPPPYVCERTVFGVRISDGRSMHCRGGDLATSLFQHNTCIALACWLHIGRMLYSNVVRLSSCRTRAVKLRPSPVFFTTPATKLHPVQNPARRVERTKNRKP